MAGGREFRVGMGFMARTNAEGLQRLRRSQESINHGPRIGDGGIPVCNARNTSAVRRLKKTIRYSYFPPDNLGATSFCRMGLDAPVHGYKSRIHINAKYP